MSRNLPKFPNLDYLRKSAKARLRKLQQRDSSVKLARAQLEIAREYGFPSWTKLKAHIESLPQSSTVASSEGSAGSGGGAGGTVSVNPGSGDSNPGLFGRFSLRARRLIFFARYFAIRQESDSIEIQHMLLGLMEEDGDFLRKILSDPAVIESVRKDAAIPVTMKAELPEPRSIPLSTACRDVILLAVQEADSLGHATVDTGHFWLALLRDERDPAITLLAKILHQQGVSLEGARKEIIRILNVQSPGSD